MQKGDKMSFAILGPEASSNPQPTLVEQAVTLVRGLGREALRVGTFRGFVPEHEYSSSEYPKSRTADQRAISEPSQPLPDTRD